MDSLRTGQVLPLVVSSTRDSSILNIAAVGKKEAVTNAALRHTGIVQAFRIGCDRNSLTHGKRTKSSKLGRVTLWISGE